VIAMADMIIRKTNQDIAQYLLERVNEDFYLIQLPDNWQAIVDRYGLVVSIKPIENTGFNYEVTFSSSRNGCTVVHHLSLDTLITTSINEIKLLVWNAKKELHGYT
jgi:hypothetical protein